jgi:uncharacterized protein (TIGR00290 family)
MPQKVLVCWSGGKDSAFALHEMLASADRYTVESLLTTVTEDYDRISMHGVRTILLEQQSHSLRLPLRKVLVRKDSTNDEYDRRMGAVLEEYKQRGVTSVVFGDIFLEDLRKYREENLARVEMTAVFPLWKRRTSVLAESFISAGFKAIITCVDTKTLDAGFTGREYDNRFLADLPSSVDPCGENGEFHTFVYAGPVFDEQIRLAKGEIVLKDERFCFCDLVPV